MNKRTFPAIYETFFLFLLFYSLAGISQQKPGYRTPPEAISELLLAKSLPAVSIDSKGEWMLLTERASYPSVEELARPELRIAGMRINPSNYSPSRENYVHDISLKNIRMGQDYKITGLPAPLQAKMIRWSPSEKKVAFLQTTGTRVDLYVIDLTTKKAARINKQPLNTVMGDGYLWIDDHSLLYLQAVKPAAAAPQKPLMPDGPAIQESIGKAAPSRTYQDLIRSPFEERLFEFYATAQLVKNTGGAEVKIGKPAMYSSFSLSPDNKYLLIRTIRKPFSYLVPASRFPSQVSISDMNGKILKVLAVLPSGETTPTGADNLQNIPRRFDWRDDAPATVTWCEPLDSGLIRNKTPYHDALYAVSAPFTSEPQLLLKTAMRFRGVTWGNDSVALVAEGLNGKQVTRLHWYNSSTGTLKELLERNVTDAYHNPGEPVTARNRFGRYVIRPVEGGTKILMNNTTGSTPDGDLPFLSKFDLVTGTNEIIWRCPPGVFETVYRVLDADKLILLTRRESQQEAPDYYIKNLILRIADKRLTDFANPYPSLAGVSKQKITYQRSDGITLTGNLYLPAGYTAEKDPPLPVLIWAYPREYNSAADAAQVRGSRNRFTTISWASPVYWVTQGYAVLDNAEMPVVAAGMGKKPNDNFIGQLKMNAEAAIGKLSAMGVGDKNRVAVGGHSYGAFMTANLLAHTNLFKAGIARSGAYNRTLTPFGFQNEDRTYWQAPELYYAMSPFSYADSIKTPLLLIHGEADDNSGTFPVQSERLYNAVKGNGGAVRYVVLPYEAHSYRGRENILHMLYEQNAWLEKYVKEAARD